MHVTSRKRPKVHVDEVAAVEQNKNQIAPALKKERSNNKPTISSRSPTIINNNAKNNTLTDITNRSKPSQMLTNKAVDTKINSSFGSGQQQQLHCLSASNDIEDDGNHAFKFTDLSSDDNRMVIPGITSTTVSHSRIDGKYNRNQ